jgi:hypothetical protein
MDAETFATWLRRQGHRVYRTSSSYWYDAGPRVLQAFPFHWQISPDRKETDALMLQHGMIALRYSSPFDYREGKVSYHVILRQPYELEMLKSQARNGVKNGLAHFNIEQISFERLATEGWVLQQDTLARQDRLRSMSQQGWERLCRAGTGLPGFEAWAATSNGELAGAVIICRIGDVFNVPWAMSHSRFLPDHVNNAVFYAVSREMLSRPGVKGIFFTVQSLDAPPNVDEFKFRMGLSPVAVCQNVEFNPLLRPFVTPMIHARVMRSLERDPANPFLAKAEGMLRLHLEAQHPIPEQAWPNCIAARKDAMLKDPDADAAPSPVPAVPSADACPASDALVLPTSSTQGVQEPIRAHPAGRLARIWTYGIKRWFKRATTAVSRLSAASPRVPARDFTAWEPLTKGNVVRVRSEAEIRSSLDPYAELRGYRFLPQMLQYCGTQQRVLKPVRQFVDERDSRLKRAGGLVLLENVICTGPDASGQCGHCCYFFWREEWLEKVPDGQVPPAAN